MIGKSESEQFYVLQNERGFSAWISEIDLTLVPLTWTPAQVRHLQDVHKRSERDPGMWDNFIEGLEA